MTLWTAPSLVSASAVISTTKQAGPLAGLLLALCLLAEAQAITEEVRTPA